MGTAEIYACRSIPDPSTVSREDWGHGGPSRNTSGGDQRFLYNYGGIRRSGNSVTIHIVRLHPRLFGFGTEPNRIRADAINMGEGVLNCAAVYPAEITFAAPFEQFIDTSSNRILRSNPARTINIPDHHAREICSHNMALRGQGSYQSAINAARQDMAPPTNTRNSGSEEDDWE